MKKILLVLLSMLMLSAFQGCKQNDSNYGAMSSNLSNTKWFSVDEYTFDNVAVRDAYLLSFATETEYKVEYKSFENGILVDSDVISGRYTYHDNEGVLDGTDTEMASKFSIKDNVLTLEDPSGERMIFMLQE